MQDRAKLLKATNGKKNITLENLKELYHKYYEESYSAFVKQIEILTEKKILEPVRSSKTNGKKPALFQKYRILTEKTNTDIYLEELKYKISPKLDISYYIKHIDTYVKEREWVLALSRFLIEQPEQLETAISKNERSFQIWCYEKFLDKEGKNVLNHLKFPIEQLNIYAASEPLAYFSYEKKSGQNVLLIENRDTFCTIRKIMLEQGNILFGVPIGTVVYGAGKRMYKSYQDFDLSVEPYVSDVSNTILYFGDMDYEGIGIYEKVYEILSTKYKVELFVDVYKRMLEKAELCITLPKMKEKQNDNIKGFFFNAFTREQQEKMKEILENGRYIPQEILHMGDFGEQAG